MAADASLLAEIRELSAETHIPAELTVIPGLTVRRPIPVLIEDGIGDTVARWVEAGLVSFGGSEGEALDNLAEIIAETRSDLLEDDQTLSRNTRRMLAVIQYYTDDEPPR